MRGLARIAVVVVSLILSAAAASPSLAADTVLRTHAAVFDSVAAQVAAELLAPGSIPAGRTVEIDPPVPGDTLSLFEQRVLRHLRAEGLNVRIASKRTEPDTVMVPTSEPAPLRLGLSVESKSVLYTSRVGRFPTGLKGYERLVTLSAQARLTDPVTGEVLWARTGTKSSVDFVRTKYVRAAASGTGLFAPAVPGGSSFGFLEPLLVTGVVVGLVVLFYSNRT